MEPHPDFANVALPREFDVAEHHLTPLSPEFVDEDFDAVMATAPLLQGFFGDWPSGLTHDGNLIDLAWHEREFSARRSFSWIVRDRAHTYIGCFYVFPEIGTRGKAKAALWLCDIPDRSREAQTLHVALADWCSNNMPVATQLTWKTSPKLD